MKTARFLFFLVITLILAISLNSTISNVPPLGKMLSPFQGYLQNIENKKDTNLDLTFDQLEAPVEIYYDDLMIPHIYAENNHDLYFAQGYVTAKDRLWQMDFFSRVVMGRLSEVMGPQTKNYDRLNRRIGLKKMTNQMWEVVQANEEINTAMTAYSDGVNAYIEELSYADYPIEFKLLNYKPEAWTPAKSCLAYAMLSNTLSRSESDLENTNALALFGSEFYDKLFPEQLGNLDPVLPKGTKWPFDAVKAKKDYNNSITKTASTIDKPNPLYGSNNFVVAGSKTKSGNVLFANEPDLQLTQPSIWHTIHQHTSEINTMGVTVPGTPVILIGFNDSIAWGVTNSPRDQVDWYKIQFRDETRKEYWYNNQWFKTESVIEGIKIKGEKTYFDTIIYVHHGPVVYDRNFYGENEKNNYAMKWMAHDPGNTLQAMYKVNRSKNYQEFEQSLREFSGPPQNFLFGSNSGDIAVVLPGTFPIKAEGKGKFLMDGSKTSDESTTNIPFEHGLKLKNPSRQFLSSANQHPVDSLYPYYIYDHHFEYNRGRRINDRLRVITEITPKDMMKLQNDNFNYQASESLPGMLGGLDTLKFGTFQWEYFKTLRSWDYFNEPELSEPTMYQLWWELLYASIWDEFDTVSVRVNKPNIYTTIHLLNNTPEFPFFNQTGTTKNETARDLYQSSFLQAVDSLGKWAQANNNDIRWFNFKNTKVSHYLPPLKAFSRDHVPIGGGKGIVNAASETAGPSWRMVVELDPKGTKAWGIYPGSQTGNPGSPEYGHMIDKWAKGEYFELVFGQDISDSDKIKTKFTFKPSDK